MNIKLKRMSIDNFKGIKSFALDLDGENAVIKAANGVGKTTVYDAFLWLLFGKDSTGRKDFEVRPLDANNQSIKGLVTAVEAELESEGVLHIFRKELHEKTVKKEFRGYETLTTIDEVPKKISEYAEAIEALIPEDSFKLLTDLNFFNAKLHWKERRAVLLDIAGEIGTPKGFDELLAVLNGRTVDDYKLVLANQKKRHEKDRDEINPRIDEIRRGMDSYAYKANQIDEAAREAIKAEIPKLDARRQELFGKENERQAKIDKLNSLKARKIQREAELKSDTSRIKHLLDEKATIESGVIKKKMAVNNAQNAISLTESEIKMQEVMLDGHLRALQTIRDEYTKAGEAKTDDLCFACGQKLPAEKLAENEKERKTHLENIAKRGNNCKSMLDDSKKVISDLKEKREGLKDTLEKAKIELSETEQYRTSRITEIDLILKNRTAPDFTKDEAWIGICKEIAACESAIGPSASVVLQEIDNARAAKADELAAMDKALAQADREKKDQARIKELEFKEKELAQKIADVEKQLAAIEQYKATQGRLIEETVNGKFKYVEFKLFNELLNGGLEDCCEATLNGVPYMGMSTGQQIFVGIDIVNVLSAHYGISVPLFIDHAESLTLPIEATSQTIELYAQKKVKNLTVERKEETANV